MADAGVTIDDAEVRRMLKLAPKQINRAMRGGLKDTASLGERWLRRYPAKIPGSTYERKHDAGIEGTWSSKFKGRGIRTSVEIGSNSKTTPYIRWVMDSERQAQVHRGRWWTVQSIAARLEPKLNKFISDRLRRELK